MLGLGWRGLLRKAAALVLVTQTTWPLKSQIG